MSLLLAAAAAVAVVVVAGLLLLRAAAAAAAAAVAAAINDIADGYNNDQDDGIDDKDNDVLASGFSDGDTAALMLQQ